VPNYFEATTKKRPKEGDEQSAPKKTKPEDSDATVRSPKKPPDYRPRYVARIRDYWSGALVKIKRRQEERNKEFPMLHIFGESGAGKSTVATVDVRHAIESHDLTCAVWHHTLDLANTVVMPEDKEARNNKAYQWALSYLAGVNMAFDVFVMVIDEFQNNVALCRGLAASLHRLRSHFDTNCACSFVIVFCGLVITNIQEERDNEHSAVSTDGSIVKDINVAGWPLLQLPPEDVAAQFVKRRCLQEGAFDLKFRFSHVRNDAVKELIKMAGFNMAAVDLIADSLQQQTTTQNCTFDQLPLDDVKAIFAKINSALLQRNSIGKITWSDPENKNLAEMCFDAAVLGKVDAHFAEKVSRCGLVSLNSDNDGDKHSDFNVSVNGFYWMKLNAILGHPVQDPFSFDSKDFEKLAATHIHNRIVAFVRARGLTSITLGELLDGFELSADIARITIKFPTLHVLMQNRPTCIQQKLESSSVPHSITELTTNIELSLTAPCFLINGDQATYGDVIIMLDGVCLVLQAKHWEALTYGGPHKVAYVSLTTINEECEKAGFTETTTKYTGQRGLTTYLAKKCGDKKAFIVFTNKHMSKDAQHRHADIGLVHAGNFARALGASSSSAFFSL
jgi:hypothetical protein